MAIATKNGDWKKTACIFCSLNCGIEVQTENGHITKIRGDKEHPVSQGYVCQKAGRLDYYQNHDQRLDTPLRRKEDGTFEPIDWDTAFREIGAKLVELRDTHSGKSLAYYGGGGQGNHLCGGFSRALRSAMQTQYYYSALAQEKTGDFWVNGKIFGKQSCHPTEGFEEAEVLVFIGKNPWQSHGIPQARKLLRAVAADPERTMIVIDPVRTKTAELADIHLQVRPGRDAYLLAAMIGHMVQQDLVDHEFLDVYTTGDDRVREVYSGIPVDSFAEFAGIDPAQAKLAAEAIAGSRAVSILEDLGIQMSLNSTLNSYQDKLLSLLTGNFGREGTNNFHTAFVPIVGHSDEPGASDKVWTTQITGMKEISKLFPPNVLPAEIDSDDPKRVRGLVVDSANPMVTGADYNAYKKAFEKLELLVVIDVAMTETARKAHYVLPATNQYEKYEAAFFNFGFPENHFHLRHPIFEPRPGTKTEPEIYMGIVRAMGETEETNPLLGAVAQLDHLPATKDLPAELKLTVGPLYMASQNYAQMYSEQVNRVGIEDRGAGLGDALFEKVINSPGGVTLSEHGYEGWQSFLKTPDKKIHLAVDELLPEIESLDARRAEMEALQAEYPFILSAGERRSYNANTICRDPAWRKDDPEGALHMHPADAESLGVTDGSRVQIESKAGAIEVVVGVNDAVREGFVTLPHGYGLSYSNGDGQEKEYGPMINRLTSSDYCDPIAKTPFHKTVPVRIEAIREAASV